jgi:UDP-N-acetylenolpyruvoylglucosamine reductase
MRISVEDLGVRLATLVAPGTLVRLREPLAPHTTLRVGGAADCYVQPRGEEDLAKVVRFCNESGIPLFLLGRGSNLLIRDGGIRGVVVSLADEAFGRIERMKERLWCGAGAKLRAVAQAAREGGLGGLEFFEGIPGTVGGALRMNAGAMGAWTYEVVESVRLMDRRGRITERRRESLDVGYRQCRELGEQIGLAAVLWGRLEPRERIEERRRGCNQRRWSSQPAGASAGCVFKNPAALPAGRLIDELGLKGCRVGAAVVSAVHANFIVNLGGATASDVLALIEVVRERARSERGVELETEVEIVGDPAAAEESCFQ